MLDVVSFLANVWLSFLAGLFAPLGAVCVLPLYPGFLAYLAGKVSDSDSRKTIFQLGIITTIGVITSMAVFGLIFVTFLKESLTSAIGVISPIAFTILGIVSIFMIAGKDFTTILPKTHAPITKNPRASSFIFGAFFGAIVLPCNPASLIVLFALSTTSIDYVSNLINFIVFGVGMAFPLLLISAISSAKSKGVMEFLSHNQRKINIVAGVIMLTISLYYLVFVFNVLGPLSGGLSPLVTSSPARQADLTDEDIEANVKLTDDGVKYVVNPDKILSGGPPKDGIPSIDNPKYVTLEQADEWIEDNELVLAIIHRGVKRVYPLQILVWHEIVNDWIAGDPLLITYCPLCGSGIAYNRTLLGEPVEFGTSGKLYNSNLVMYDRLTNTYWSQIDGLGILGELAGEKLSPVSIDTVSWRDWKTAHSDSEVLSKNTGFSRRYGEDPYGNYYEDSFLLFPVEDKDDRIHPKTVVFGVEVGGVYKAYMESDLKAMGVISDKVNDVAITVTRDESGIVRIEDDAGEEIVKERDFWFAWYAFHPDTTLYEAS